MLDGVSRGAQHLFSILTSGGSHVPQTLFPSPSDRIHSVSALLLVLRPFLSSQDTGVEFAKGIGTHVEVISIQRQEQQFYRGV